MKIVDWILNYWMYITGSGVVLLVVAWFISAFFKTVWGEWKHGVDTKRCESQEWKRDPFHKLR